MLFRELGPTYSTYEINIKLNEKKKKKKEK